MLPAVSAVRAAVPSLRTTSPNPINAVLLPEAAQVNRDLPAPTRTDITQFNLLSGMWRSGGFTTQPMAIGGGKRKRQKGGACALYPGGAHDVIDDETKSAGCCIVWPPPCLHNGFYLLEKKQQMM